MKSEIEEFARKYALQNAVSFNGRADSKAVIGKVIAEFKQKGISPKDVVPIVNEIVKKVNSLSLKQQISELEKSAPELLRKEKKERDFSLPELPFAEKGEVITRFPPEPNGYLHIGHAKAVIIDYEYAKKYDGKFILRFDDTNPENAKIEFYDAQKEDLKWLGIEWDFEYNTSDNLEKHYKLAEQLINQGDAYICKCSSDVIKEGRFHSKACSCRERSCGETIDLWRDLIKGDLEGAILRLHGEMGSDNTAMRDPTLFRVIETEHPLQGTKYRVWPTYDFAGAVEDSVSGVTHPFRTKEYELRDPVYFRILSLLNLRKPNLMEFSRLSITGMPVSKRKIKPLIDQGLVSGYDDVRLPTLKGLKRRGIIADAIKQFVFTQGISKVESSVDFSVVEAINRKLLDSKVKRLYFVPEPVKLKVENASNKNVKLELHPSGNLGARTIKTSSIFYIPSNDVKNLKLGDLFRLKGLYNVKILKTGKEILGEYSGEELISDSLKIQWTTEKNVKLKIIVPRLIFENDSYNPDSLKEIEGYAEEYISQIKNDEIVQFERVGFVRIEKQKDGIIGYFAHK